MKMQKNSVGIRIVAIILAASMILGIVAVAISMLISGF